MVVHNPAFLKGDTEVLDELAVEHIGLCAIDDALYSVLVGRSEHFLSWDVGQEHHALFALAGGAFPHSLIRKTHGQVRAIAALKMHAFQVQRVHFIPQSAEPLHMGLPLVHRVAAGDPAHVKDQLPQSLHCGIRVQLREDLLCPRHTGQGRNGPLHPVVHGVLLPLLHKGAAGGIHPADLIAVNARIQLRVVRNEMQYTHAALAFGIVKIAAQLPWLEVGQSLLAAQLHAGAGHSVIAPVHLHIPGTGFVGTAHAQPRQRRALQRAVDDEGLSGLRVHPHPDDEIGIFFQQFVKVFHGRTSCGVKITFSVFQYTRYKAFCPVKRKQTPPAVEKAGNVCYTVF